MVNIVIIVSYHDNLTSSGNSKKNWCTITNSNSSQKTGSCLRIDTHEQTPVRARVCNIYVHAHACMLMRDRDIGVYITSLLPTTPSVIDTQLLILLLVSSET